MKQLKHYLLTAICFFRLSGILLIDRTQACSNIVFSPLQSIMPSSTTNQYLLSHPTDPTPIIEEFSFLIKDFKINHQSEINNLNITIRYRYVSNIANADYHDFRLLAKDIEKFLTNYSNQNDYWEILNKKITSILLEKYPSIVNITSEMQVSPSPLNPYLRSSITTQNRPAGRINKKKITRIN